MLKGYMGLCAMSLSSSWKAGHIPWERVHHPLSFKFYDLIPQMKRYGEYYTHFWTLSTILSCL